MLEDQRPIRARYRLFGSDLEAGTTAFIPTGLWLILGIYVAWFGVFLVLAVDNKPISAKGMELALVIFRAIVGGIVPLIGAYGIATDKFWTRWFIPVSFVLPIIATASRATQGYDPYGTATLITLATFIVVVGILFISPGVRSYYEALRAEAAGRGNPSGDQ